MNIEDMNKVIEGYDVKEDEFKIVIDVKMIHKEKEIEVNVNAVIEDGVMRDVRYEERNYEYERAVEDVKERLAAEVLAEYDVEQLTKMTYDELVNAAKN